MALFRHSWERRANIHSHTRERLSCFVSLPLTPMRKMHC